MKCANPIRVWKVGATGSEMRRYRLEILGVSEVRWNQYGETELVAGELFIYSGKENKDDVHEKGSVSCYQSIRRNA